MKNKKLLGFTISELLIVMALLAILGTISIISFSGHTEDARNAVRFTDINNMEASLETYYFGAGKYPEPTNSKSITYKGAMVWKQGSFGNSVLHNIRVLSSLPLDPSFDNEYSYSVLNTGVEYELVSILEGNSLGFNFNQVNAVTKKEVQAYTSGNYNGLLSRVSTGGLDYILAIPSITANNLDSLDITNIIDNNNLVYDKFTNIPTVYKNSDIKLEGNFKFDTDKLVIFSGSLLDLAEGYNQVAFLKSFQSSYSGTIINDKDNVIKNISRLDIDPLLPTYQDKLVSCAIIKFKLKYDVDCDGLSYIESILRDIIENDISGGGSTINIFDVVFNLQGGYLKFIFNDDKGYFWFGTNKGLTYYDGSEWTPITKENSPLLTNNVRVMSQDDLGNYWIGTNKGVNKLSSDLTTWTTYTQQNNDILSNDIKYIFTADNGTVWIGTKKGVSYLDGAWGTYTKNDNGLTDNQVKSIFEDDDHNIWFGTLRGLSKMTFISDNPTVYSEDLINYKQSTTARKLPNNQVRFITQLVSGDLWFGTNGGIGVGVSTSTGIIWKESYLDNNTGIGLQQSDNINYIFEDSLNNIWVGTEKGVGRLDNDGTTWTHYGKDDTGTNKLKSDRINTIYEDEAGSIIIGGFKGYDTINTSLEVDPINP